MPWTAAVGVIPNLSVWFAVHTAFPRVQTQAIGLMRVDVPHGSSIDLVALVLSASALVAMPCFKIGMGWNLSG